MLLRNSAHSASQSGVHAAASPHGWSPPKPWPVALLGSLRHHHGSRQPRDHPCHPVPALHRALCPGGREASGRQGSFMPPRRSQLQPRGGQARPPLLPVPRSQPFSPSWRNKAAPGRELRPLRLILTHRSCEQPARGRPEAALCATLSYSVLLGDSSAFPHHLPVFSWEAGDTAREV